MYLNKTYLLEFGNDAVNSAAAFKCHGYGFESLLAAYLAKGSLQWRGTQFVNARGIVH